MKKGVLLLILGLVCTSVSHSGAVEAQMLEYGIFSGGNKLAFKDTRSPNGKVLLGGPVKLEKQTSNIPARLNLEFGVRFVISDASVEAPVRLHLVYLFPPINHLGSGKQSNRYEVDVTVKPKDKNSFMLWDLTEASELVPGQWTFQIFHDNRKLLEQNFHLVSEKRAYVVPYHWFRNS